MIRYLQSVFLLLFSLSSSGMSQNFDLDFQSSIDNIEWPSCDELRTLWLTLQRLTQHAEITNEIPIIPTDLLKNFQGNRPLRGFHIGVPSKHRQNKGYRQQNIETLFSIGDFLNQGNPIKNSQQVSILKEVIPEIDSNVLQLTPQESLFHEKQSSNVALESPGFFGGFGNNVRLPDSPPFLFPSGPINEFQSLTSPIHNAAVGFSGFDTKNDKQSVGNFEPTYGLKEDVGSFGAFSPEDEAQEWHRANIRTVKVDNPGWHGQPTSIGTRFEMPAIHPLQPETCEQIERKPCSTNNHCACTGWETLSCVDGKCHRVRDVGTGSLKDLGTWHDGPLSSSQLGLVNRRKRRGKRSKTM